MYCSKCGYNELATRRGVRKIFYVCKGCETPHQVGQPKNYKARVEILRNGYEGPTTTHTVVFDDEAELLEKIRTLDPIRHEISSVREEPMEKVFSMYAKNYAGDKVSKVFVQLDDDTPDDIITTD